MAFAPLARNIGRSTASGAGRVDRYATYPSLSGKRVFVTGGATGIGAALVAAFCEQQADVGFVDIDQNSAIKLADEITARTGQRPWFEPVDVCQVTDLQDSIKRFCVERGGLDVLINNVSNDTRHDTLEVSPESWRACLAVNLDAAFFASQEGLRCMQQTGGGSVINLSSITALIGTVGMPGYTTSKAALLGLTKSLARQFGRDGIRVNAILPGWVVTERQLEHWLTPDVEEKWLDSTALNARIYPAEVARLALFLAADDSHMITNQHFIIDGGAR